MPLLLYNASGFGLTHGSGTCVVRRQEGGRQTGSNEGKPERAIDQCQILSY